MNGYVDAGCVIRGELEFSNSFRIDGRIEGTVRSQAELVIGESGVIEGDVEVARCLIGGTVRGRIIAKETVVLHSGAKVWGDVFSPSLIMEEGAFLEGGVSMDLKSAKQSGSHKGKQAPSAQKSGSSAGKSS